MSTSPGSSIVGIGPDATELLTSMRRQEKAQNCSSLVTAMTEYRSLLDLLRDTIRYIYIGKAEYCVVIVFVWRLRLPSKLCKLSTAAIQPRFLSSFVLFLSRLS